MTPSPSNSVAPSSPMPRWLTIILVVTAMVVLGPPALALLFAALGIAVGLTAVALKLAVLGLAVYLVVMLLQSLFGKSKPTGEQRLNDSLERLERDDAERRALDEELARAVAATKQ